jgi:O-antigen ligase/tetratricopeptide (TPR) repeat protein
MVLIFAGVTYLPFAWREWTKPVAIGDVTGLAPAFALVLAWAAVSAVRTPAMYLTVNAIAALCAVLMSAGLVSRLARDRNALVAMLFSITAGATIVALICVREYISFVRLHVPEHRSFSTFVDPNFLAGYLLLTIPIALSLFICSAEARIRWFSAASVLVQSSALWLSGSRAGSAIILIEIGVFVALALFIRASAAAARLISIALALFVVGSLPALSPLLSRMNAHAAPVKSATSEPGAGVVSSDAQVNSNEFRRWTWIGTASMARANPLIGTGLGAFDLSYSKYAETAYAAHAHNSYLQLMAESGYPTILLVMIGMAAAGAFAAHSLVLQRNRAAERDVEADSNPDGESYHPLLESPELLLIGLVAGVTGSMLHSLIDSDWYVVANLFTLATVVALAVAVARDMAPLSTRRPSPLRKEMLAVGAVVSILILWRGGQLAQSRMNEVLGSSDFEIMNSSASADERLTNTTQAKEAFRSAAASDPLDPEPHFGLAEIAQYEKDNGSRLKELKEALARCRSGKAYYRIGQYYMAQNDWASACEAFEHARELEPKMLQNLHALAGAYIAAGKTDDAIRVLQMITSLQLTPYGQVRAMHESVETEFAYGHAMLGDIYAGRKDWPDAAQQFELARNVLSEYWMGRHFLVNTEGRTADKRRDLADLYERVLQQLQEADVTLSRPADAQAAGLRLETVRKERAKDDDAASSKSSQAPSSTQ